MSTIVWLGVQFHRRRAKLVTFGGSGGIYSMSRWPKALGVELGYMVPYPGGGVLNFELGTDVRPEVSTTTL